MQLVACPSCRRRGTAHAEREVRGSSILTLFCCSAVSGHLKPRKSGLWSTSEKATNLSSL